jgi:hypothetical protein
MRQRVMPDDQTAGPARDWPRAKRVQVLRARINAGWQPANQAPILRWKPGTRVKAPCSASVSVRYKMPKTEWNRRRDAPIPVQGPARETANPGAPAR